MTTFDEREHAFEAKLAHDEELKFKARARRNKRLGLWAAGKLGKTGAAAEGYASRLVATEIEKDSASQIFKTMCADFDRAGVVIVDHAICRKMDELLVAAVPAPAVQWRTAELDVEPLPFRLFAGDDHVDVVAAAQTVVGDRQQAVCIGRQIDAHDIGFLVGDVIDEAGILVGEAVVVLAPDMRGEQSSSATRSACATGWCG